ncbi:MAG: GntR family transcriptional regulator [Actinomycetota bacterium]
MDTGRDTERQTDRPGRGTLRAQAYNELKRRLLQGDYPIGRRLAESALAEQLQVSRTPIRDALSRLHAEGLVSSLPEGGFTPAAPDLHSVGELYEIRRALEFSALHRGGHDPGQLRALRHNWSSMVAPDSDDDCSPDFVLHDESFHVGLATATGNQCLVEMLVGVNERIRIVRMHDFLTADRVVKTIEEHLGIVNHLIDGDVVTAADALGTHLQISEKVVEQRAAQALSRMISRRRT